MPAVCLTAGAKHDSWTTLSIVPLCQKVKSYGWSVSCYGLCHGLCSVFRFLLLWSAVISSQVDWIYVIWETVLVSKTLSKSTRSRCLAQSPQSKYIYLYYILVLLNLKGTSLMMNNFLHPHDSNANLWLRPHVWYFSAVSSWTCDAKGEKVFVGFSKETLCWHGCDRMQGHRERGGGREGGGGVGAAEDLIALVSVSMWWVHLECTDRTFWNNWQPLLEH